jgi:putative transposase
MTWHVLQGQGIACGKHRVARLRRQNGMEALRKRRFRVTVEHHKRAPAAANTLDRQFAVLRPDRVWVGDMTVVPRGTGWLHLAVIMGLYSRRVVGWAMGSQRGQALAIQALQIAIEQRDPAPGLLHHTNQCSAYTGADYHALLTKIGAKSSMSRRGNCYDNAVVESFFSNLKNELTHHRHFFSREEARAAIFEYVELFYSRQRAHATLQYASPVEYERSGGAVG